MTGKEALELLKDFRESDLTNIFGIADEQDLKALDVAMEALEKSIPKEPYHTWGVYTNGDERITDECPYCEEHLWRQYGIWDRLVDIGTKYCWRCGQAIDWDWMVKE